MAGNSSGNVSVDVDVDEVLKRIQAGRNIRLRALYQGFLFSRFFSDLILLQPDTGVKRERYSKSIYGGNFLGELIVFIFCLFCQ